MTKELERDLGLWSVMAISVGAMVGSGIFILPALAMEMAGSGVVIAYLLAGILVLPAALSKSEMATAMPEAGGTYIYIERSMGPLLGTIAGIGTWFALSFKGTLALVGGAPYIVLLFGVRPDLVAVGAAVVLIGVNLVGAKQTGRMQIVIVGIMLAAMAWFVVGSSGAVDFVQFEGLIDSGATGLLTATGFVFVSYAGVTKVASVAEEIENPGRNIPLGMLGSLGFTTLLYVLVVVVIVGAAEGSGIIGSNTPVADVASTTLPKAGVVAIVGAAILALISTANAGLLSSSRYPYAMSRDGLAPVLFESVSERFSTPTAAIALTGGMMLLMIVFVPLGDIAKLGSAFQILVFVLINVAIVAFRESDIEGYDPEFRDPFYPWSQAFGVVGGLVLLTQMGSVPAIGTVVIVAVGVLWYAVYARERIDREGIARSELRRRAGALAIERTKAAFRGETDRSEVLVALTESVSPEREGALAGVGAAVAAARDGSLTVVRFDEVSDQLPLESAREMQSPDDIAFERRMEELDDEIECPMEFGEIVSHDARHAIVNFARHDDADLLITGDGPTGVGARLLGRDVEWITRHVTCDLLLVDADGLDATEITLLTDQGSFDPLTAQTADAIAEAIGCEIRLVRELGSEPTDGAADAVSGFHGDLAELFSVPVRSEVVNDPDPATIMETVGEEGLLIAGDDGAALVRRLARRESDGRRHGSIIVHPHERRHSSSLSRLIERVAS